MKETGYLDENISILENLKKLPIIASLDNEHVKNVIKLCKINEYEAGEPIFDEGGFDQHIFFLMSGKVKVVKNGMEVRVLDRCGDVFGEMGIIDAMPRSAAVYAIEKTNCLKMDVSFTDRLAEKDREVCLYVIYRVFTEVLSNRLRETTTDLMNVRAENERLRKKIS